MRIAELEKVAVDQKMLATNFADVIPDCCNDTGADVKNELQNRYELYFWLLNTELARRVRTMIEGRDGACILHKDAEGQYVIEVPATFYSLEPTGSAEECCWSPLDFAKCKGNVPVHRLCLKDCDNIDDELMSRVISMKRSYGDIAREGESVWNTKKRIARLSMAFLTNNNVIDGMDTLTTDVLKPFHGLLQVMANPAVNVAYWLGSWAATMDSIFCRMAVLGGLDRFVFAVHPLIYTSLMSDLRKDRFGSYPEGWTREGNEIRFNGIRFIRDVRVPLNLQNNTGEIWTLDGASVGLWMVTDLMPTDAFIKESGHMEQPLADGCGRDCTYYYNYGAVFNNNANRLIRIQDVPVSLACAAGIEGLNDLIVPNTLIPA